MTSWQKAIKYAAMAFAIFLIVGIIGGILSAVAGLDVLFGGKGDDFAGDMKTYQVGAQIEQLEIEISAAELEIVTGEEFRVESNHKYLSVKESGSRLVISETQRFSGTYRGGVTLTLYIPEGTVFDKADITTGAGVVTIGALSADRLTMDFGAGKVDIETLSAYDRAEINGGAGQITVRGGELDDLDLDMGVGELNLTSRLSGECDVDCGVGETNLTLLGSASDYRIQIDKGLGEAVIDGQRAKDDKVYGTGGTELDVDGGVGRIEIGFQPG